MMADHIDDQLPSRAHNAIEEKRRMRNMRKSRKRSRMAANAKAEEEEIVEKHLVLAKEECEMGTSLE